MIVFEFIIDFFLQIIFEGIICGFFRLIRRGYNFIKYEILGFTKPEQPHDIIKQLEKKFLYKKIELKENLNQKLVKGLTGAVLEIIDENKVFAEFYDTKGKQIELNNELVFEIRITQFDLR